MVFQACNLIDSVAKWSKPDYRDCETKVDDYIYKMVVDTEITDENAANVTESLLASTNEITSITKSGVNAVVATMQKLRNHTTPSEAYNFVNLGSNLLDASSETLSESKERYVIPDLDNKMRECNN